MATAETAKDYVLTADNIPSEWKITSIKKWDETYAMEREAGIIDKYTEIIETDKNEYVQITALLFSAPSGSAKCLSVWKSPGWSTGNTVELDIGDGGFYYPGHTEYGDTHDYCFRKGNIAYSVWSRNKELAKEAVSLLLGEKIIKETAPGSSEKYREKKGRTSNTARKVIGGLAGAGAAAGIIYGLFQILKVVSASLSKGMPTAKTLPSKSTPKVTIKKPVGQEPTGPSIKIKKPPEKPPPRELKESPEEKPEEKKKEKEEKKKRRLHEIALQSSPSEVTADGKSTSLVKIFAACEDRYPASGETIELWFTNYDGSKIEPSFVITNIDGEASAKFTAGKLEGVQILSAQAKSNPNIMTTLKIKLKEEIYYEVRDHQTGFKIRVNIPRKGINTVNINDVLGTRILDNFDNEARAGYPTGLIDLAALIGYYGISDKLTYTKETTRWENLFAKCSRIAGELESAMGIGLGVGVMTFTGALSLIIAEEFGGKLISTAAKVLGKAQDKADSKIGLEKQDQVYNLIQKEKDYMAQMSKAAEELAELWSQIDNESGDPHAAVKLIKGDLELEFYKLNSKILTVAIQKAKITDSFSQSDFDTVNKDIENINKAILELNHKIHQIQVLRERIRGFAV